MSKPPHSQRGQRQQQHPAQGNSSVATQQRTEIQFQQWSGPLPPPATLEKFNEVAPNGADRLIAMAEKEQAHRLEYESRGLDATTKEARRGQYLGTLISIVALSGAIYTAHIGAPWGVSVALVGIPVLGIIRAIVKPRPQGPKK